MPWEATCRKWGRGVQCFEGSSSMGLPFPLSPQHVPRDSLVSLGSQRNSSPDSSDHCSEGILRHGGNYPRQKKKNLSFSYAILCLLSFRPWVGIAEVNFKWPSIELVFYSFCNKYLEKQRAIGAVLAFSWLNKPDGDKPDLAEVNIWHLCFANIQVDVATIFFLGAQVKWHLKR